MLEIPDVRLRIPFVSYATLNRCIDKLSLIEDFDEDMEEWREGCIDSEQFWKWNYNSLSLSEAKILNDIEIWWNVREKFQI